MGNRILLLDAWGEPSADVSAQLAQCGLLVQVASNIDDAILALSEDPPALVLLRTDDPASVALCRSFCTASSVPILVICTKRDEDLVVQCLEAGADSVLLEPLSRRELAARVGAALGRPNGFRSMEARPPTYRAGDLLIDLDAHVVTKAGLALSLTPTEFRLLVALAQRVGEVVSQADLLSEVWGHAESPENLRLYIGYLRRKLEDDRKQPSLLLNQRGVGYRLAEVATSANGRRNVP